MGGVFLRRDCARRCEVINDISGDVTAFYRILQRHYEPFMDMLRWRVTGRAEFERLMATGPSTLAHLQRAAYIPYLRRAAPGNEVAGWSFGACDLPVSCRPAAGHTPVSTAADPKSNNTAN
ncbi:MAG: hypothetical protein LCH88_15570 [Proteobacteria bacterium]|nr:hypothetical protein [Pseudomonadota bacterium]